MYTTDVLSEPTCPSSTLLPLPRRCAAERPELPHAAGPGSVVSRGRRQPLNLLPRRREELDLSQARAGAAGVHLLLLRAQRLRLLLPRGRVLRQSRPGTVPADVSWAPDGDIRREFGSR